MANYVATNLLKAQVLVDQGFQAPELRFPTPAVWNAFVNATPNFLMGLADLRAREDRATEMYYIKRTKRALGTGRSHNHAGNSGDSATVPLVWNTRSDVFSNTLKQADNNLLDQAQVFGGELVNTIGNFMVEMNDLASTYLVNNRSGVNVAAVEGTFNAAADVYEITDATEGARAVQIAETVMQINAFESTNLIIFCDSVAWNKFNYLKNQGASNATNWSFQFANKLFIHDITLHAKAQVINPAYSKGFFEVIEPTSFGVADWIPRQNREGVDRFGLTGGVYSSILNPVDGLRYALHTYVDRADGTAKNGYTQDVNIEYEISIDQSFNLAPLSEATATPLLAFALV